MGIKRLEIFFCKVLLGKSLFEVVLLQDSVLDEVRVSYVVQNGISEDFKSLILNGESMILLERFVCESLQKNKFVLELIV